MHRQDFFPIFNILFSKSFLGKILVLSDLESQVIFCLKISVLL